MSRSGLLGAGGCISLLEELRPTPAVGCSLEDLESFLTELLLGLEHGW